MAEIIDCVCSEEYYATYNKLRENCIKETPLAYFREHQQAVIDTFNQMIFAIEFAEKGFDPDADTANVNYYIRQLSALLGFLPDKKHSGSRYLRMKNIDSQAYDAGQN